jgi:NAD(P)-dependent dehydrogenase (short-subunit alcohol dehydrogenase family)
MSALPLAGRRVALTGGSRGIGLAIARRLLDDGASVALCSRDGAAVSAAVEQLRVGREDRVAGWKADVTDTPALARFAREAELRFGGIDSLVANAGIWGPKGPLMDVDFDEWLHAFDVNVHGVVRTLRAFIDALRRSEQSRIVVMVGGGSYQPYPYLSAYGATKSGLARLGESIAEELIVEGITLNMMLPGPVNTAMVDELLAAGPELLGAKRYQKVVDQKAAGGVPPERGAALCAFLLSDQIEGVYGKLISQADSYESIAQHRQAVMDSDAFTLRRVTPKSLGYDW